ncbi:unnamed protein product [Brugia timori]|uniref:Response regulator n=1 Tax=Brugia timori TaxID=42155 RepID=A0A0R3Q846_9BILA|nr:unnamed protein product [Brugia timori]
MSRGYGDLICIMLETLVEGEPKMSGGDNLLEAKGELKQQSKPDLVLLVV